MADKVDLDLEYMYVAGKKIFPDTADEVAAIAKNLHHHLEVFNEQSALAGDPSFMTSLLKVGGEAYDALRGGVVSLNSAGAAMVLTANDFKENDEDAQRDFNKIDVKLDGQDIREVTAPAPAPAPPRLPDPAAPGAPLPEGTPWHPGLPGSVESTPDPESPDEDAQQREANEEESEREHARGEE